MMLRYGLCSFFPTSWSRDLWFWELIRGRQITLSVPLTVRFGTRVPLVHGIRGSFYFVWFCLFCLILSIGLQDSSLPNWGVEFFFWLLFYSSNDSICVTLSSRPSVVHEARLLVSVIFSCPVMVYFVAIYLWGEAGLSRPSLIGKVVLRHLFLRMISDDTQSNFAFFWRHSVRQNFECMK